MAVKWAGSMATPPKHLDASLILYGTGGSLRKNNKTDAAHEEKSSRLAAFGTHSNRALSR